MKFIGEKFDRNNPNRFNRVWICSQIRADLKREFDKTWKFGVRKESGDINITIKKAPEGAIDFDAIENGFQMVTIKEPYMKKLNQIVNAYNYDDSDGQIDYFDRNYYVHYDFDINL